MRTIKRKRLFTKRTSRKSIRRKKLFRKILQRGGQIENPLGKLNSEPISQLPENDSSIAVINAPTHFTGNITKVGNRIELSNFEERKSRKLGWMYGQYIGNFNIVFNDNGRVDAIKSLFANKGSVVKNSLFIPPLDDKIKISEEFSPWKTRLYDIDVSLIDENCETTMKNILVDFYDSKLKHSNRVMIKYIIDNSEDGIFDGGSIISKDDIHKRYLPGLLDRSLYDKDKGLDNSGLVNKTWNDITDADREKLNAFRLKQQIFMRNTIDIFSEYNDYIIPFNMEYYKGFDGANIDCITFLKNYFAHLDIYNKSIDNGLLSKILQTSLSSMLCNFSKVHKDGTGDIFSKLKGGMFSKKNSNIRTKSSTDASEVFETDAGKPIEADPKEKYIEFEYKYYINSLITPKILTELLLYNIIIKKMIILEKEGNTIKPYKEQKTSDFLDAMGRGEEYGFNKHFKELYILRKLQAEPFSESQETAQSPYNIARDDKREIKSWYEDMKNTARDSDRKFTFIKIEKDVKNANGEITKVSTPYLYQIEENDEYMCIYVLNEKLYNDLILKDNLGKFDIKEEKHLKNFNAIADKKDIFDKYFENLLSEKSGGHTSRLYTLTPEAS